MGCGEQKGEGESVHPIWRVHPLATTASHSLQGMWSGVATVSSVKEKLDIWDFILNVSTFKCWALIQIFFEKHCAGRKPGTSHPPLVRNSDSALVCFPGEEL